MPSKSNTKDVLPPASKMYFVKVIALGWRDGVVEGVGLTRLKPTPVRLVLLETNPRESLFAVRVSELPKRAFADVLAACAPLGRPKWPIWVPLWRWPDKKQETAANTLIERACNPPGGEYIALFHDALLTSAVSIRPVGSFPLRKPRPGWIHFAKGQE